ncbi:hypothetical protein ACFLZ7_03880 [Nanoarchaeota archaeon]
MLYGMGTAKHHEGIHEDLAEHRESQAELYGNLSLETANGDLSSKLERYDWDIVVLHLGPTIDPVKLAQECRQYTKARLVAEASEYPSNKRKILRCFDSYISPAVPLEHILKNAGLQVQRVRKRTHSKQK